MRRPKPCFTEEEKKLLREIGRLQKLARKEDPFDPHHTKRNLALLDPIRTLPGYRTL